MTMLWLLDGARITGLEQVATRRNQRKNENNFLNFCLYKDGSFWDNIGSWQGGRFASRNKRW